MSKLRVLVACEFSGRVREAFRKRGHDAWSCDLLPAADDSPFHYRCTVLSLINEGWDMIIAFPPCTHLSNAGAQYWPAKRLDGRQQEAIEFVKEIAEADCERIAIENPCGILSKAWRKPDQIINPFQFGEPYRKKTCLWLKGLPPLVPTDVVEAKRHGFVIRKTGPKAGLPYNYYFHQGKNAIERGKTFQGTADAMGQQWGNDMLTTGPETNKRYAEAQQ